MISPAKKSANKSSLNLNLEALRGIAAILVVFTHFTELINFHSKNSYFSRMVSTWGTESVIIFFVLSGIVIRASFEKRPVGNLAFLKNRILRIHPILIVSIIFTVLLEKFAFKQIINPWQVAGNIIPVSTFNASLALLYFKSNPVIWSLSFEMFFYVVFALGGIYRQKINLKFIYTWFGLGCLSIIGYYLISSTPVINYLLQMMAFSPIWLVGFFIWHLKDQYRSNLFFAAFSLACLPLVSRLHITTHYYDPIRYLLFAITSIPFFIYLCNWGYNIKIGQGKGTLWFILTLCSFIFACIYIVKDPGYTRGVKVTYMVLPLCMLLFYSITFKNIIKIIFLKVIRSAFSYIGTISYSLYIIHFPILTVISLLSVSIYLKSVLGIVIVFSVSILLENYYQPFIKSLFIKANTKL